MKAELRKFLIAGTVLCLSVAPALSLEPDKSAAQAIDSERANAANVADIAGRDMNAYQAQMRVALAMTDTVRRDAAVTAARRQLAQNTGRKLTAGVIAELDGLLEVGGASPQLGATG
jgi:hypothetical protein